MSRDIKTELTRYEWAIDGDTAAAGTAFRGDQQLSTAQLVHELRGIDAWEQFVSFVGDLTGHFALITPLNEGVGAAVDQFRTLPLFYDTDGAIRDSPDVVNEPKIDREEVAEFLLCQYVTGSDTLTPSVSQIQAGEAVLLTGTGSVVDRETHCEYAPSSTGRDKSETVERLDSALGNAIGRLVDYANGRQIAIPLSGGVDSRLIALHLKRAGYNNIFTFTYGQPGESEVETARQVADDIGLEWEHVEYTPGKWSQWYDSDERRDYFEFAGVSDALPPVGSWPALKVLKESGRIGDDAIIVPGQTVASVSEHVPARWATDRAASKGELVDHIFDEHYTLFRCTSETEARMKARIASQLPDEITTTADLRREFASWEFKERQGKFMAKAGMLYADWGYDFWFPLVDREFITTWGGVSPTHRFDKQILRDYTDALYPVVTGADAPSGDEGAGLESVVMDGLRRVASSPLGDYLLPIYKRRQGVGSHPLGYNGILNADQYEELNTGYESHHSFRSAEAIGLLSFRPPDSSRLPDNNRIAIE